MLEDVNRAYAVDITSGVDERTERSGLSHAEAMTLAEAMQRTGSVARVMHVIGSRRYEVDRYPPR